MDDVEFFLEALQRPPRSWESTSPVTSARVLGPRLPQRFPLDTLKIKLGPSSGAWAAAPGAPPCWQPS